VALPTTLPQIPFALAMLALGIASGRSTRAPGGALGREFLFEEREGI